MTEMVSLGINAFLRKITGLGVDCEYEMLEQADDLHYLVWHDTRIEDACGLIQFHRVGGELQVTECAIQRQEDIDNMCEEMGWAGLNGAPWEDLAARLVNHLPE